MTFPDKIASVRMPGIYFKHSVHELDAAAEFYIRLDKLLN